MQRETNSGDKRLLSFGQKINRLMTTRNQCILFVLTFVMDAVSIFDAATDFFPEPVSITLYAFAAVGFVLTCTLWVKAVRFFVKAVLLPFTRSNKIANTLTTDRRLHTVLTTLPGMGLNMIYAVFNGGVGIASHSAWYGTLSAYYLLLCAMRFLSVAYARQIYSHRQRAKQPCRRGYLAAAAWDNTFVACSGEVDFKKERKNNLEGREWKVYRNCGIMLSVLSMILGGAVMMLVSGEGGKSYPGLMIYTAATYTFYKLTVSIINLVKARKEKSVLLITLRNIGYADSLVSLLSLQTALFTAFGQDSDDFVPMMNALTGAAVCLMVLFLGISMVYNAKKEKAHKAQIVKENEG